MNRKELVTQLELLAPALGTNAVVLASTHYWFRGTMLQTFDTKLSMRIPFKTPFKACVPGNTLLKVLKTTTAKEIEFDYSPDKDEVWLNMKSTKLRLATLPEKDFIFNIPKGNLDTIMEVVGGTRKLIDAIKLCLVSVTSDTSNSDHLGITLIPEGKKLGLYAWGNDTISHAMIELKKPLKIGRVLVPAEFWKVFLKLVSPDEKQLRLNITDEFVQLQLPDGGVLHAGLRLSSQPFDFAHFIKHSLNSVKLVEIPPKLWSMMERAELIVAAEKKVTTTIIVADGRLRFDTNSRQAEVTDTTTIDAAHDDVVSKINIKQLALANPGFEKIGISEDGIVFTADNWLYVVSSAAG